MKTIFRILNAFYEKVNALIAGTIRDWTANDKLSALAFQFKCKL